MATQTEVLARIDEVYRLLLTGSDRRAIHRYARMKGWDVSTKQVDVYITRARKEILNTRPEKLEEIRSLSLARLGDLYSAAYKRNDYKTCLAIQKHLEELHGLTAPIAISIDQKITLNAEELTDDQLAGIISAGRS